MTNARWGWQITPGSDAPFFQKNYPAILTTVTNLGAMIAALGAGPLVSSYVIMSDAFWQMEHDSRNRHARSTRSRHLHD